MTISYDSQAPSRETTREVAPRQPRAIPAGLCASCEQASECDFRWASGQSVLQCDEFRPGVSVAGLAGEDPAARHEDARPRMGLCASCLCADTCSYARGRYGVWNCTEYE